MKTIFTVLSLILSISLSAQNPNDAIISFSGGVVNIKNMPAKSDKIKGSVYQIQDWSVGNILLKSGETVKNYPLKYDLKYSRYEIKTPDAEKVLNLADVKEVSWMLPNGTFEHFVNSSEYESVGYTGMYKIVAPGTVSILRATQLKVEEGHYNPALDVGTTDNKYVQKNSYYTLQNGKIAAVKLSKKKILSLFGDKAEAVKQFAKTNKLKYSNEAHLARIFDYYYSL